MFARPEWPRNVYHNAFPFQSFMLILVIHRIGLFDELRSLHTTNIANRVFRSLYKVDRNGNFVFKGFNNSKKSCLQWGST